MIHFQATPATFTGPGSFSMLLMDPDTITGSAPAASLTECRQALQTFAEGLPRDRSFVVSGHWPPRYGKPPRGWKAAVSRNELMIQLNRSASA